MKKLMFGPRFRLAYFSLQTKFILIFFLLITVPFLISGAIAYQKYSNTVEENSRTSATQLVNQTGLNLDQFVQEIERLTLFPFFDESVLNILKIHSGPNRGPVFHPSDELLKMTLFLSSLSFNRPELQGVFIYANDGSVYRNFESNNAAFWQPADAGWMGKVNQGGGGLVLVPPHLNKSFSQPELVFSIARQIREPDTGRVLGIEEVALNVRSFDNILSLSSTYPDTQIFIQSEEGFLLYPELRQTAGGLPEAASRANFDGTPFLQATHRSDYSKLQVTALVPLNSLRKDANAIISYTLLISVVSLIVAYLLAVTLTLRMVKPIRQIQARMFQVGRGAFDVRASVERRDEIGDLAEGFNHMVSEIERLIKEVYQTRLHLREAELYSLQSQINPHFLYNTLETINMMALQSNQLALSDVVSSLGKLLRYTVDNREERVCLGEELLFVEAYLRVQALRYGERLEEEIEIDPSLESCLLPKLILQPLVENAVHYACQEQAGRVKILALVQNQDLYLRVQDNGPGISPAQRVTIEQRIYSLEEPSSRTSFGQAKKGVGLRNIHQRLRLLYGEPYGLTLDEREKQGGCSITLRLPLQVEELA